MTLQGSTISKIRVEILPTRKLGKANHISGFEWCTRTTGSAFLIVDGDGVEDFITARLRLMLRRCRGIEDTMLWLENGGSATLYPPIPSVMAGGLLFNLFDMDGDNDLDIFGLQFALLTELVTNGVLGGQALTRQVIQWSGLKIPDRQHCRQTLI